MHNQRVCLAGERDYECFQNKETDRLADRLQIKGLLATTAILIIKKLYEWGKQSFVCSWLQTFV